MPIKNERMWSGNVARLFPPIKSMEMDHHLEKLL